jgi:hypothetical protein
VLFDTYVHRKQNATRTQYLDTNRELIGHTFFIGDFSPNVCEDELQELEQTMMTLSSTILELGIQEPNLIRSGTKLYVYYKHDHDAPERPYHPERVQSHVSFFMKTINTRP